MAEKSTALPKPAKKGPFVPSVSAEKFIEATQKDNARQSLRGPAAVAARDAAAKEAAGMKDGGRSKRASGGTVGKSIPDTKRVGPITGGAALKYVSKGTSSGGGGCDANPFTSARAGTPATGRRV